MSYITLLPESISYAEPALTAALVVGISLLCLVGLVCLKVRERRRSGLRRA